MDHDAKGSSVSFEGSLGKKGLITLGRLLQVYKREAAEMIHKDCGHLVPLSEEETLVLSNEARDRRFELVNGDTLTRLGHCSEFLGRPFVPPWSLGGFAEEAGGTLRNPASSEALGNFASGCHQPKVRERQVTKAKVPAQELG